MDSVCVRRGVWIESVCERVCVSVDTVGVC